MRCMSACAGCGAKLFHQGGVEVGRGATNAINYISSRRMMIIDQALPVTIR